MTSGTTIGSGMTALFATDDVLYALDGSGNLQQYQFTPNSWTQVSGPMAQFAAGGDTMFALDSSLNVWQFQGIPNQWLQIGTNIGSIVACGSALYGEAVPSGNVVVYEGVPGVWKEIGVPVGQLVTNGRFVFAISVSSPPVVQQYVDQPPEWIPIGGSNPETLYVAPNALYLVDTNGDLSRWQGESDDWLKIGQGWLQFAALGTSLYAISSDGSAVGLFQGVPGSWQQFAAGPASAIAAADKFVYVISSGNVLQYPAAPPQSMIPRADGRTDYWIWTFQTADEAFAGYDGDIRIDLFWGNFQQTIILSDVSFKRDRAYNYKLPVGGPTGVPLQSMSLSGEENFFDDQWHVSTVTAWDPTSFRFYTFEVNAKVPNRGSINTVPTVTTVHTPPQGLATVYVWDFLGKDVAWGHASIELGDGTYISWWPQGVNRDRMKLLPEVYTVAAVPNQTFENDQALEYNQPPDWRVVIGGLDLSKVDAWWATFKTTHQWSTLSQNCSTTVADALWAGGARKILTSRENDNFDNIIVWVPNDVLAFAQAIVAHGS